MPEREILPMNPPSNRGIFATAWPATTPTDSDSLRRRKFAVRAGLLAMVLMVLVAAVGGPLIKPHDYSLLQLATLIGAGILYVLWNAYGTRGLVTLVLWDGRETPPLTIRRPQCGVLIFFVTQVCLASMIYFTSDRGRTPDLAWLALLPPVAYAVFILEWRGIATISVLMLAILFSSRLRWHEWLFATYAGLAFSFAVLFTIVFSMLAVQAEKARNEVQRLAEELRAANDQLREHAVQAEELSATRERNRIAREIHDTLGHFLTVANIQLEAARSLGSSDPDRAAKAVVKAQSFVQEGLQDIRRSVAALHNSPLDNKPLTQALQELLTATRAGKPASELVILGQPRNLSSPAELSLYRAAQEGLTNVHKHAEAQKVQVILDFQTAGMVSLCVHDDGKGAATESHVEGFGLRGLRERANLLGGKMQIKSIPDAGFNLKLEVPG